MDGRRNLLTDVAGIRVGNAHDPQLASGVTVVLFDRPAVASVFVAGGAPAGRDLENLEPDRAVERIDAILVSGGSGFGLDAASGAQAWLRERGRGLPVRDVRVPIVPSAILFDLLNGGDKDWVASRPIATSPTRLRGCGGQLRAWECGRRATARPRST
jgi:L-aminopeptidase/D-esterase-like protein